MVQRILVAGVVAAVCCGCSSLKGGDENTTGIPYRLPATAFHVQELGKRDGIETRKKNYRITQHVVASDHEYHVTFDPGWFTDDTFSFKLDPSTGLTGQLGVKGISQIPQLTKGLLEFAVVAAKTVGAGLVSGPESLKEEDDSPTAFGEFDALVKEYRIGLEKKQAELAENLRAASVTLQEELGKKLPDTVVAAVNSQLTTTELNLPVQEATVADGRALLSALSSWIADTRAASTTLIQTEHSDPATHVTTFSKESRKINAELSQTRQLLASQLSKAAKAEVAVAALKERVAAVKADLKALGSLHANLNRLAALAASAKAHNAEDVAQVLRDRADTLQALTESPLKIAKVEKQAARPKIEDNTPEDTPETPANQDTPVTPADQHTRDTQDTLGPWELVWAELKAIQFLTEHVYREHLSGDEVTKEYWVEIVGSEEEALLRAREWFDNDERRKLPGMRIVYVVVDDACPEQELPLSLPAALRCEPTEEPAQDDTDGADK